MFESISRYLRTISYLRGKQVVWRCRNAVRRLTGRCPSLSNSNVRHPVERAGMEPRTAFAKRAWMDAAAVSRNSFRFLNREIDFGGQIDWHPRGAGRLWKYNLHYFDYLHCAGSLPPETGMGLIRDWIENNRPGAPDAWDPYPTSLRLVNWIKYLGGMDPDCPEARMAAQSAYQQAGRLERDIEYHLLGNHLFKNAKALVFCGLFFRGKDARRWLSKGIDILGDELVEQVLPDGGHFERSPMYHGMILEDCLDLLNVCSIGPVGQVGQVGQVGKLCELLLERLPSMMRFLSEMTHPDGGIALFNDAALSIEIPPRDLGEYYRAVLGDLPPGSTDSCTAFPDSGYFIMAPRPEDRLIMDCGPVGPDYQPGHSHCDTLSFELSIGGRRVVVDSGCCQYEDGPIRRYNRGNAGHNTVTIDGRNQSEVWGAHRCARRARPIRAELKQEHGKLIFEGAHDGYRRLDGNPVHHRSVVLSGGAYEIRDRIEGRGSHSIESTLHIHPSLDVNFTSDGAVIKGGGEFLASISSIYGHAIEKTDGWYCPEFGIRERCCVLRTSLSGASLPVDTGWVIRT